MGSGEDALIEKILSIFGPGIGAVGIGDDAAVVDLGSSAVVTNDLLIENVDFTREIPLEFTARKSLAVNVSDLAAMGARPRAFVLALGIPEDLVESMDGFLRALHAASERWGLSLIGGDLSASAMLTISITAFGRLAAGAAMLRSAAEPGQSIYVSRPLGAAACGLHLLNRGWRILPGGQIMEPEDLAGKIGYGHREFAASVIHRQVTPEPEVELGPLLAEMPGTAACIDISDGLSTDLMRICRASGVGAVLEADRIPRFPDLDRAGFSLGADVDAAVLHGGEELALLFTSQARESELSGRLGRPVYRIGRIVEGDRITLASPGGERTLEPGGFDHFN